MSSESKCSVCKEVKPLDLFKKDKNRENGRSSWCKACHSRSVLKYQKTPQGRRNKLRNSSRYKQTAKGIACNRRYKRSEVGLACRARDYEANRDRYILNALRRKERVREHQTPSWADMEKIAEIYREAARVTRETGIPHHVDHIIPLTHLKVCGLHVENNLQVITAAENLAKSNKFVPGVAI